MADIIKFPKQNPRFDVSNIPLDPEDVALKIREMKLAYFATVADSIVDDVMRSIAMLRLDEGDLEIHPVDSKDLIIIKEAVVSILCRIIGTDHPLHEILEDNIVITASEADDYTDIEFHSYQFKSQVDKTGELTIEWTADFPSD